MMIGFVDQNRNFLWNRIEQLVDLFLGNDDPRRVVRIAKIDESGGAQVFFGSLDGARNILAMVRQQGDDDGTGLQARRILIDRPEGWLGADNFLAAGQKDSGGGFQDFG